MLEDCKPHGAEGLVVFAYKNKRYTYCSGDLEEILELRQEAIEGRRPLRQVSPSDYRDDQENSNSELSEEDDESADEQALESPDSDS